MHISKVSLVNYRNFANAKVVLRKGVNTIIGENGSGKTNLFRAIRLLLDENMRRSATRLEINDFHRGLGDWKGHWIIISLEFDEVSEDEAIQSLFLHGSGNIGDEVVERATYNLIFRPRAEIRAKLAQLKNGDFDGMNKIRNAITIGDYETVFTGKSDADFNDPELYREVVGDFENVVFSEETEFPQIGTRLPNILTVSQEICFTYIQALRDVVGEFQNSRTNPLLTLLRSKSGDIDPADFAPIAQLAINLNESIEDLQGVQDLRDDITSTIKDSAGHAYSPASMSIKSELSSEADKLFHALKLFVGESNDGYEGAVHELSLGGANLIFITLKLLEFKYQKAKQSFANFLVIEEPEAHIHTHIQKTLFDRLNFESTQIIYSTHSPQISEVSNVENVNVLSKGVASCEAFQPTTGLTAEHIGNVQRYLDAIRSNLLFAKSVILVEGDAEELLIPLLAKKVFGLSLDELGISLVNVRSTGFENVAALFHDERIRKRCAIVSDLDAAIVDTTPDPDDDEDEVAYKQHCKKSEEVGAARERRLDTFIDDNVWLELFLAPHTFEVDFVAEGNEDVVIAAIDTVYRAVGTRAQARADLEAAEVSRYGRRVLTMADNVGKGWFALLLGRHISHDAAIPDYILDAIFFASGEPSPDVWCNILEYRLRCIEGECEHDSEDFALIREVLDEFRDGSIEFAELREQMEQDFPDDAIVGIMGRF